MARLTSLVSGIKALVDRKQRNREIDEELGSFFESSVAEKMRRGMSREDAVRAARAEIGSVQSVKHKVWSAGWESMAESWSKDLAYTFRRLFRSPALVLTVILSIGLGIAANATIFSLISRFVLRPAPVGDPSTLLTLAVTHDGEQCCNHFPWPAYIDVRDQAKTLSGVAAYYELVPASISGFGEPERVWGQAATANFFDVAQLPMALGRGFALGEENLPVIVLGHHLWQRRFASDPSILGKTFRLSGRTFTVIGVAPSGFHGLDGILNTEFWISFGNVESLVPNLPKRTARDYHWVTAVGRMRPGVSRAQVGAELDTLAGRFAAAYPATDKGNGFHIDQAGSLSPRDKPAITLFLAGLTVVVLLVLAIACANVANLLLAQAYGRQKEMAVRLALGSTRAQLIRQMLLESVVLSLGGGIFGILLSVWATSALSSFHLPVPVPLDLTVNVDWRVLAYTFALSVGAGLLFGFAPAMAASRATISTALKGEDALARVGRVNLRSILVVAQVAISVVLLCATGLFLRSLESASRIDVGFGSGDALMISLDPGVHGYTAEHTVHFLNQLRERVAALPGVTSAVVTDVVPLSMGTRSDGFQVVGNAKPATEPPIAELYMASPGYFQAIGIPSLMGRDFSAADANGPRVAIVNRVFAERLFGHENPIGRQVIGGGVIYQIIGVVGNIKSRTLGEDLRPVLFRSLDQTVAGDPSTLGYTLLVRTSGDAAALAPVVRREVTALDATMAVFNIETMRQHLREALFLPRLAGTLFGIFGFIGLLLASIGLYSVMSYSVSRRTQEIGIRMALGARTLAVQQLIVRQGMRLSLIAVFIGLPLAFAAAKFSSSLLYGVRPHDLATFTIVPIAMLAVALFACWIPSRRASRVDPIKALRCDG
jgi:predicted permease